MNHRVLAGRFNARLGRRASTWLIGGAAEPVYLPPRDGRPAVIRYTRDYARSVLHELAHWCLADEAALGCKDYGLYYEPPPRTPAAQARFYAAEVPVQGLELLLSEACGVDFRVSADNPGADDETARRAFECRVWQHHGQLLVGRLPPRALSVLEALNPGWREVVSGPVAS